MFINQKKTYILGFTAGWHMIRKPHYLFIQWHPITAPLALAATSADMAHWFRSRVFDAHDKLRVETSTIHAMEASIVLA